MALTPPQTITAAQAIAQIQAIANPTVQQIKDIVAKVDARLPVGSQGLFYSGSINGTESWKIAGKIQSVDSSIGLIGDTQMGIFLNDPIFKNKLDTAILTDTTNTLTANEIMNGKVVGGIRQPNGIWDVASGNMASEVSGNIKIIAPFAKADSVLMQTEIIKLINNPKVTSINGVPIEEFKTAWYEGDTKLIMDKVKLSSVGEVATLTAAETGALEGAAMLGKDGRLGALMNDILHSGPVGDVLSNSTLQKMGTAGDLIAITVAAYKATESYNKGDKAGAVHIMEEWAAEFVGGVGGGIAAVQITTAIIAATVASPGIIAAGFVLAAAIGGAYYGGEAGKWLLEKGIELELYTQKMINDFVQAAREWWHDLSLTIDDISDAISAAYWKFLDAVVASFSDPLIVDLNGDGIKLDSFQTSTALFDLDGNGTKENTGWTRANTDDAFLVIDKNNNNNIDNITEMFGNASTPGFADLKSYDSNKDGVINATDTQFSLLKLWNDKNANGVVDAGEMTTLAANGITSISLNYYNKLADISGNIQTAISTVTKTDGTTRNIHEFDFGFETPTVFTNPDAALPATFQLNIESILMPYSRGYGSVYSWQAAMTLDPTLLAMAQDMMTLTPATIYKMNDKFEAFLFRWAKVENVTDADVYDLTRTHLPFDARKVAFMEKITGGDFTAKTLTGVPLAQQAWNMFFGEFLNKFLVQGPLAAAFPHASYDFATDTLKFNDTLDNVIAGIKAQAAGMDANSFVNYAFYAQNILKLNKGQFADAAFDTKVDAMLASIITGANITGFTFDGRLNVGTDEIDILYGTTKNDILNGGDSNDELYYPVLDTGSRATHTAANDNEEMINCLLTA